MNKPYAESCDQNKSVILSVISKIFSDTQSVLEIGSGTGQHAVHFASHLPHLKWYTSDRNENLDGIAMWLKDAALANTFDPIELDVSSITWPTLTVDAVFTANSIHIMSDDEVIALMTGVGGLLTTDGICVIYGPFNYNGNFTSDSNARFDQWLKSRDSNSGIKNFEDIVQLALNNGLQLADDITMPENNRILHFVKE